MGVYVEGTYDALNRITDRDYSGSTPDVDFYYDGKYLEASDVLQTATGSVKGKTTGIKSTASRTNYPSFDEFGRPIAHQQITDGETYSTAYAYNLSGALIEETYPSGRVVKHDLDADGALSRVYGNAVSQTEQTYANSFNYNTIGAVEALRLGNGKWETAAYNNRQQITQIGLGNGADDTSLLKLEYDYGTATENNGSLRTQKISFDGLANSFEQTYTYDDLNRLQSAEEKVDGNTTWKQTFLIDRYGNRRFDTSTSGLTTTLGSCTEAVCNPEISTATNRFTTTGYTYDKNGNLIQDAEGRQFVYDAENQQTEVKDDQSNTIGEYLYDGEGKRVKKVSNLETTVFVYNGGGQLVAEYSTQTAQNPQISYLTTDHLGSPRVITDENGAVIDRKDYTAFGEVNYTPERVTSLGYSTADEVRKGYTGYEKDDESGLDFAQARYYKAAHGRYTSVDPLTASASIRNPQTFNRYSYVLNSPYKFTDPLGLLPLSMACGGSCPGSFMGTEGSGAFSSTQNYDSGHRIGAQLQAAAALAAESTPTNAGVATSQSGTATGPESQVAQDPPIIDLVNVSAVDSLPSEMYDQEELAQAADNNNVDLGGGTYDARLDVSELNLRFAQGQPVFLRVDLQLIGDGSFTTSSDTAGVHAVSISASTANNVNIVSSSKNLSDTPGPTIDASATSVSVYTPIIVPDVTKNGRVVVTVKATVAYRSGRFEGGKLQLGNERNKSVTKVFRISIRFTP